MTALLLYEKSGSYCTNHTAGLLYENPGTYCIKNQVATVPEMPIYRIYKIERRGSRRNGEVEENPNKKKNGNSEQQFTPPSPFRFAQPEGEVSPSPLGSLQRVNFKHVIQCYTSLKPQTHSSSFPISRVTSALQHRSKFLSEITLHPASGFSVPSGHIKPFRNGVS